MSEREEPIRKTPAEVLADLMAGHDAALAGGHDKALKYLTNFIGRANSVPNAVKFFLYDLMAEDASWCGGVEGCRVAVATAEGYLEIAREDAPQAFREYLSSIRLFERGISLAIDEGEFERALSLCDRAIGLGLGKSYEAKRASIERMTWSPRFCLIKTAPTSAIAGRTFRAPAAWAASGSAWSALSRSAWRQLLTLRLRRRAIAHLAGPSVGLLCVRGGQAFAIVLVTAHEA